MTTQAATPSATLADLLTFTPDDLQANRDGQLSEWQMYRLRVRRRRSMIFGLLAALAVAFIATLFLYEATAVRAVIGIGLTLCNAALLGIFGRYWLRLTADIRAGKVHTLDGQLERVVKPVTRRVLNYMIRIGEVEMIVPKELFDTFEHQAEYRIYRTPYTGILLSAERQIVMS